MATHPKESQNDSSINELRDLHRLLHDASQPAAAVTEKIDDFLRKRLIQDWVAQSAGQLTELGVRRVIVEFGAQNTMAIRVEDE